MDVFVLDSSAIIRYIDKEAGEDRVRAILQAVAANHADVCIPAVQWGEIAGNLRKRFGASAQQRILERLVQLELEIVPASAERAVRAAELRVDRNIAYADAFALDLAMDSADHVLVTADYDFKAVNDLVRVEFLPVK